jgi:hypothetical protein
MSSLPIGEILLVADNNAESRVLFMLIVEFHPLEEVLEGLEVGDIVDQDAKVGVFEVAGDEALKAFLASRVPELQAV